MSLTACFGVYPVFLNLSYMYNPKLDFHNTNKDLQESTKA